MTIIIAAISDIEAASRFDKHITPAALGECIRCGRVYLLADSDNASDRRDQAVLHAVGILRYSLFWQTIPFLDLLYIDPAYRGRGFGTRMMHRWESDMAARGYTDVMTSTQADETAWQFYEKLGYHRIGGFLPPGQEAEEWMYLKHTEHP